MLKLENINAFYGDLQALLGISLDVNEGELVALVGPVTCNEDGTGNVWNPLIQWLDGQLELVWPEDHATVEFYYPAPPFDER